MKIGIIGAMLEEVNLVKAEMQIEDEVTIGRRQYWSGTLYDKDVVLVFSKCGKVAAATAVTTLIQRFGVGFIIFTGVAGAAAPGLRVGDVVVADNLVQHDMDVCALPGYNKFEIPMLGKSYFEIAPEYSQLAQSSAISYIQNEMRREIHAELLAEFGMDTPQVVVGTVGSGDQFIADKDKIRRLREDVTRLQCVEMEGAAVAQVCFEHDISYIVVRVISDNADDAAPINFRKFVTETASYMTCGIIRKLVQQL